MMTDPIADMLTRIRNGQAASKVEVAMPSSKLKCAIAEVLKDEGYIIDYSTADEDNKTTLTVALKYHDGKPVIEKIQRSTRASRRGAPASPADRRDRSGAARRRRCRKPESGGSG